jgi:hypothetical protein
VEYSAINQLGSTAGEKMTDENLTRTTKTSAHVSFQVSSTCQDSGSFLLIILLLGLLALLLFGVPYFYWRYVTPTVNEFKHVASAHCPGAAESAPARRPITCKRADTIETRLIREAAIR